MRRLNKSSRRISCAQNSQLQTASFFAGCGCDRPLRDGRVHSPVWILQDGAETIRDP